MKWNREKIYKKVTVSADRYGDRNPQQWKQLVFALSNSDPVEVWEGLYSIFLDDFNLGIHRQELAGKLLYEIAPDVEVDLEKCIRACLSTLNLSIEQLPRFLADKYGKEAVIKACSNIDLDSLSEVESNCLNTFKWWLGGRRG